LKKGYPVVIIFGGHIFTTQLAVKWPFSFPPYPTSASALPGAGENKSKILHFYSMQYHYMIKIMHIWHIFFPNF